MRRQLSIVVAGTNGTGKSTFAMNMVKKLETVKPVLFVLPDDEEKLFWDIDEIDEDNVARELIHFKKGFKKLYADDCKIFDVIRQCFKNGVIVIDDARVYLTSRDEPLRKLYMRRRQINCDIIFICHGLSEVPPSCSSFITDVVLFETIDEVDRWTIDNKNQYIGIRNRVNKIAREQNRYYNERLQLRNINL